MNMPTLINTIFKLFHDLWTEYIQNTKNILSDFIVEIKTSDQINENFSKRRKFNMSETLSLIFFREDKRQKITRLMDLFIIECMTWQQRIYFLADWRLNRLPVQMVHWHFQTNISETIVPTHEWLQLEADCCRPLQMMHYLEWWRDYWTVSDVIEQSGVTEHYLANAIISDKSKWR